MMEASFLTRHPRLKDIGGFVIFVVCVIVGTLLINTFVFRSFSVTGPSMEQTLYTGDRLIARHDGAFAKQLIYTQAGANYRL